MATQKFENKETILKEDAIIEIIEMQFFPYFLLVSFK